MCHQHSWSVHYVSIGQNGQTLILMQIQQPCFVTICMVAYLPPGQLVPPFHLPTLLSKKRCVFRQKKKKFNFLRWQNVCFCYTLFFLLSLQTTNKFQLETFQPWEKIVQIGSLTFFAVFGGGKTGGRINSFKGFLFGPGIIILIIIIIIFTFTRSTWSISPLLLDGNVEWDEGKVYWYVETYTA